ncbi:MAG: hypothetical protein DRQ40_04435, partial [Gammaproteobacteria bacterium]
NEDPGPNEVVDAYFKAKASVHKLAGYVEDWVDIPLGDYRGMQWMIIGSDDGGTCVYGDELSVKSCGGGECYSASIYTQRFLPKWVYRSPSHVLICIDTQIDGNKFLGVFDTDKEVHDEDIKASFGGWM